MNSSLIWGIDREYILLFSPSSQRMAYVAGRGDKQLVVADGQEGKEYDSFPGEFVFDSPKSLHTLALQEGEIFRVEVEIVEE